MFERLLLAWGPGALVLRLVLVLAAVQVELWAHERTVLPTHRESVPVPEIPMSPLKPGDKLVAGAAVHPVKFSSEQKPWLFVKVQIASGHHIYAMKKSLKSSLPTRLTVTLPDGVALTGEWEAPEPEKIAGALVYRKEVVFRNRLTIDKKVAPARHKAQIELSFQVCNEALCWPPDDLIKEVEFEVVKNTKRK